MSTSNRNALALISEILDKMIDMQQTSTEATTSLKSNVEECNRLLKEINGHFTNGFRKEIKDHFSKELEKSNKEGDEQRSEIKEILQELKEVIDQFDGRLASPMYWTKLVLTTVGATAVAIAGVVAIVIKLME